MHEWGRQRCLVTKGVFLHEVGGTSTHVHVAVNIEPHVCVSTLLKGLKGASSYEINRREGCRRLEWQRGYGVVSFGVKQLEWVKRYVANQDVHHSAGTTHERLERVTSPDGPEQDDDV